MAILARFGSSPRPGVVGCRKPLLEACHGGGLVAGASRSDATSHRARDERFRRLTFRCCCASDETPPNRVEPDRSSAAMSRNISFAGCSPPLSCATAVLTEVAVRPAVIG